MRTLAAILLTLGSSATALAQQPASIASAERAFDPVAAIRAVVAAPTVSGVRTVRVGNLSSEGSTIRMVDVAVEVALDVPLGLGEAPQRLLAALTAPVVLVDGLDFADGRYRADAIRIPSSELILSQSPQPRSVALSLGRIVATAPSWPAAPSLAGGSNAGVGLSSLEAPARWLVAMSAATLAVDWPDDLPRLSQDADLIDLREADGLPRGDGAHLLLADVARGRIGRAGMVVSAPEADRPMVLTARDLDLTALADALFREQGAQATVLGGLWLSHVTLPRPDGSGRDRIGLAGIEGIRLAPSAPSITARVDAVLAASTTGAVPDWPIVLDAVDAALSGVSIDTIFARNISGWTTAPDGERSEYTLAGSTLSGVSASGPIDMHLADLTTRSGGTSVSLARADIEGVRLPQPDAVRTLLEEDDRVEAEPAPPNNLADLRAQLAQSLAPIRALPIIERIALADLVVDSPQVRLSLDTLWFEMGDHIERLPTRTDYRADLSVVLKDDEEEVTRRLRAAISGQTLHVADSSTARWTPDGRIAVQSSTRVDRLGEVRSALALSGVPRVVFGDPSRLTEVFATLSLDGAAVSLTDLGVVNVAMTLFEESQGLPWASGREEALRLVREAVVAPGLLPEGALDAIAAFLDSGGTLSLVAKPKRPVPFFQLATAAIAPTVLPRLLNIRVRHSR